MPDYVVRRLINALNRQQRSVSGSRILLLGLAYKKNTGDARESPAVRVVQLLRQMGAEVRVADPHVVEAVHGASDLTMVTLTAEELRSADAVVLLADHDAFDYDLIGSEARYVLDTRRRLRGPSVEVI
jgi:UDP-N-acetyl-D-glucosamine dehydrogenase